MRVAAGSFAGRLRRLPWRALVSRRALWSALLAVVVVAAAAYAGLVTASVRGSLGPHEATYDVTTDALVVLDLGPLGTVEADSPLPLGLGARIVVQEIPADVVAVDQATTLAALEADASSYLQFFTSPQAAAGDAVRALVADAVQRAAVYLTGAAVVVLLLFVLLGEARRTELVALLRPHQRSLGAVLVLVVVGAVGLVSSTPHRDDEGVRRASMIFAGTPLEGARITGRLAGIVDHYGGMAVEAWRSNEAYYEDAAAGLRTAWHGRELQIGVAASHGAPWGAGRREGEDPVSLVVISDLHCNVGMAPVIAALVEVSGSQVVLDAGDRTINGTSVERYCVTALDEALPSDVDLVAVTGNHDSSIISDALRDSGATVLDGSTVEVAGVRILGDADPVQTRIGDGSSLAGTESAPDMAVRLRERACEDDVDLLLIHTPAVGRPALASGCVPLQVSGHLHARSGPDVVDRGVLLLSGSTAGAVLNKPTVGPLNGTATLEVLTFDRAERRFVSHRSVTVDPDGTVFVGFPRAFPVPAPVLSTPPQQEADA